MPDLIYVLITVVTFALLALVVGALGRRLDEGTGAGSTRDDAGVPHSASRPVAPATNGRAS